MEKQTFNQTVTSLPLPIQASVEKISLSSTVLNYLLLAGTMGVGAFLRLWQINLLGFNTDEAVYSGQAAALAQIPSLKDLFPVFRAHPLLLQLILSLVFRNGVNDLQARLVSVAFGLATIFLVYMLGCLLYNKNVGVLAALFIALMPYHVIVSRQVLLDGPLVFFATLTFYMLAKFVSTERPVWLYMVGIGMGLTFLAKETGIILLGSIYAFLALSREIRIRILDIMLSLVFMVLMISPYPISLMLAGGTSTGQNYFIWQLLRRANHPWDFYLNSVPPVVGYLVIFIALLGFLVLRHEKSWRERLLVWWIIVPVVFFELWPTKGFQYLLPIAPAFALLAGRTIAGWSLPNWKWLGSRRINMTVVNTLVTGLVAITLFFSSWQWLQPPTSTSYLAGTGGIPGGREAGDWILANIPKGATLVTIGPSMANIIRFYGLRKTYGLSISPNPLFRNPAYVPVDNPDLQIRNGEIQYIVWDSFSADRSIFFSDNVLKLIQRFHGRVVHTEFVTVTLPGGTIIKKPVIIIYEVHP
jgi:hypothetical protein